MNKSNLIIALFSFLPILNVIDFGSKPREFIYLLPILLYTLPSAFIREKEKADLDVLKILVPRTTAFSRKADCTESFPIRA